MELEKWEALSRLRLTEREKEKTAQEIEEVIGYFDTLSRLDTQGVEPLVHHFGLENVLREDEVKPSAEVAVITANARCEEGFFVTPTAVEE